MKILYLLFLIILLSFTSLNAQFVWNQTVTAGDTMVWANSALTLFYQIHPYTNSTGTAEVTSAPIKSSKFWTGSNNGTRRDSLGIIATTKLDSLPRIFIPASSASYTLGGWQRFIVSDGTHKDTSGAIRIGNKIGAETVFYYFDDVGTTKILEWLYIQVQ